MGLNYLFRESIADAELDLILIRAPLESSKLNSYNEWRLLIHYNLSIRNNRRYFYGSGVTPHGLVPVYVSRRIRVFQCHSNSHYALLSSRASPIFLGFNVVFDCFFRHTANGRVEGSFAPQTRTPKLPSLQVRKLSKNVHSANRLHCFGNFYWCSCMVYLHKNIYMVRHYFYCVKLPVVSYTNFCEDMF